MRRLLEGKRQGDRCQREHVLILAAGRRTLRDENLPETRTDAGRMTASPAAFVQFKAQRLFHIHRSFRERRTSLVLVLYGGGSTSVNTSSRLAWSSP